MARRRTLFPRIAWRPRIARTTWKTLGSCERMRPPAPRASGPMRIRHRSAAVCNGHHSLGQIACAPATPAPPDASHRLGQWVRQPPQKQEGIPIPSEKRLRQSFLLSSRQRHARLKQQPPSKSAAVFSRLASAQSNSLGKSGGREEEVAGRAQRERSFTGARSRAPPRATAHV